MTNIYNIIKSDEEFYQKKILKILSESEYFGLAQINSIAGHLEYNAKKIANYINKANDLRLKVIAFPEYSLIGTSMQQTIQKFPFLVAESEKYLKVLAKLTKECAVVIGFINKDFKSCIAVLQNGKIIANIENDFYSEHKISGLMCGFYIGDNYENFKNIKTSADVIINCSSIQVGNNNERKRNEFLSKTAKKLNVPILNINTIGTTDSYSYNGTSRMYNKYGVLTACAKSFEEQLLPVNPIKDYGKIYFKPVVKKDCFSLTYSDNELEELYKTLIQGIKDYFEKCGLKRAVIGLSGGLDSTICSVLLADAIGKENVFGISMPSELTSNESKSDAYNLAKNLGINYTEAPIKKMFDTTSKCFKQLFNNIEMCWNDRYKKSFTPDNIQARSRAMYLWGIANEFPSCIPIATSDKSEAYMGYATINGDMSGGIAPIADVTKTKLFALAKWMNEKRKEKNVIPVSVTHKRPGAELAIDQNTGKTLMAEDALMPYDFLDEVIWRIENKHETYDDMINSKFVYENKNNITQDEKEEWLKKFFKKMSLALFKCNILPPAIITQYPTNVKSGYYQPITSGKINYKKLKIKDIEKFILD